MQINAYHDPSIKERISALSDPLQCITMYENAFARARKDLADLALERALVLLEGKLVKRSLIPSRLRAVLATAGIVRPHSAKVVTCWRKINRGGSLRKSVATPAKPATTPATVFSVTAAAWRLHPNAANDRTAVQRAA